MEIGKENLTYNESKLSLKLQKTKYVRINFSGMVHFIYMLLFVF